MKNSKSALWAIEPPRFVKTRFVGKVAFAMYGAIAYIPAPYEGLVGTRAFDLCGMGAQHDCFAELRQCRDHLVMSGERFLPNVPGKSRMLEKPWMRRHLWQQHQLAMVFVGVRNQHLKIALYAVLSVGDLRDGDKHNGSYCNNVKSGQQSQC